VNLTVKLKSQMWESSLAIQSEIIEIFDNKGDTSVKKILFFVINHS